LVRPDGTRRSVEVSVSLIQAANGSIEGFRGIVRDITARKQAEEALRAGEDRYRDLVENSHDLISTHDLQGQILSVNPAVAKLTGYTQSESVEMNLRDFMASEVRDGLETYLATIRKHGAASGLIRIQTRSGERRIWEYHNTLRVEGVPAPIVRSMARDVTERVRAEKALRASEKRFRALIENSSDAIVLLTADHTILYSSVANPPVLGFEPSEVVGQRLLDWIHPEDVSSMADLLGKVQQEPNTRVHAECRCRHKDGSWRWVEGTIYNLLAEPSVQAIGINYHDITERKRAEIALENSEARYRSLVETAGAGVATTDLEGNFTFVNQALCDMLGYRSEELLDKPFADFLHPDDVEGILQIFLNAFQNPTRKPQLEFRAIHKDGHAVYCYSNPTILWHEGQIAGFNAVILDVTARKRAEEALAQERNLLRTLIDNLPDRIYAKDVETRFILNNAAHLRALGVPAQEEALGKTDFDFRPREIAERHAADDQAVIQSGEPLLNREEPTVLPTGETGWLLTTKVPLRDPQGRVIGLVGISRDITKRKRAEEALRETQQTLEAVIQASPLPILALNRDGSVKMWNPAAERTFGWNAEQVLGRQNPSVPGEKLEESDAMFLRVLGGSGFSGVETRRQRKDGSLIDVSISTAPLRDGRGSINGIMAVVADITERKQAEAAIRRRNEELAALNQVGRTLSKLAESHEILDLIYKTIGQVLDNDNFYIALYDEASQQISFPIYTIEGQRHARDTRAFANGITEYVIRTKAPLFIPSHHDQTLARLGIDQMSRPSQCLLAVPMLVGDKAIGVITVQDYARENVYDTAHVELLSTFAAQAAIALENARLFAETQRRADEFAALYDTTRDLAAQQDLPILLDTIVERAMRLFAVPAAGVSLYDPTRGDLERVVAKGYTPPPERRVPLGEGMIGRVAQTRQPLIIDNYQTWAGRSPRYENIPITSNMQVPMLHRGELIGVLGVSEIAPGRREFTETDVRLLSLFAAQAASAVHSTRLLTETQSRARQLEGLYQIGQTINGTLEMETILETVVDEAMRVSGAQLGFIAVVDQTTQRFIYRALRGYTPERQARTEEKSQSLSEGLNGRAYHTRQVVQISDVRQATDYLSRFSETRTELVVPMIRGDRVIGNIDLQSPRVGAFDGADLSFLRALADEAAIALENARLFKETHQRAQRQAALYQISTTLARVRGVQETCEAVARAMRDALNYPNLEIFLLDPKTGDRVLQVQFGADNVQKNWRIPPGEGVSEKAILTGKLQYWRDVTREPRYVPALRDSRSEVDVPIKINDSVLGVLIVEDTGVDAFNAEDFDVLQTVANQLAVALENARLFGETRQRLDELEAINKVSTALRAATALEEMFPLLLDEALNLLKTDIGILSLYDPESDALHRVVARGMPEDTPRVPIRPGEGIMGQVFATGEAHVSREYVNDPLLFETTRDRAKVGWGGVCVPVRTAEEVIGVLSVSVPLPREITPVEVHLLTTLAEMAGNAIHRMRLHEQTERRLERLTALRAVDTAIVSSFDLGFTLNVLVNHIITQLEVDAASILLFNEHTQILEYAAGRGFRTKGIERSHLRLGEGYAGRAALERRVTSCPDLREVGNARARLRLLAGEGFVAYFGVPLIAKGQIKGVLDIFHRTSLNPDQEWLGFLETLAGQAALAIDNAELFNHLQRANTELSLAYDATIEGWSHALDLRDRETEGHTRRVAEMTVQLAQMIGVSKEELVHIRRGALLHDIGKMGTPDNILHKPGPLTDAEWEIMHQHPVYAYEFLSPIVYLRPALDIPHCHHEKWDGTGYPRGLAAEQIPLAARIFAVVDVWDALRSDRPYRSAWAEEQVLEYLRDQVGKHFDPKVAEAFLRLVG
jgi:PAS domain S-box-containing protein